MAPKIKRQLNSICFWLDDNKVRKTTSYKNTKLTPGQQLQLKLKELQQKREDFVLQGWPLVQRSLIRLAKPSTKSEIINQVIKDEPDLWNCYKSVYNRQIAFSSLGSFLLGQTPPKTLWVLGNDKKYSLTEIGSSNRKQEYKVGTQEEDILNNQESLGGVLQIKSTTGLLQNTKTGIVNNKTNKTNNKDIINKTESNHTNIKSNLSINTDSLLMKQRTKPTTTVSKPIIKSQPNLRNRSRIRKTHRHKPQVFKGQVFSTNLPNNRNNNETQMANKEILSTQEKQLPQTKATDIGKIPFIEEEKNQKNNSQEFELNQVGTKSQQQNQQPFELIQKEKNEIKVLERFEKKFFGEKYDKLDVNDNLGANENENGNGKQKGLKAEKNPDIQDQIKEENVEKVKGRGRGKGTGKTGGRAKRNGKTKGRGRGKGRGGRGKGRGGRGRGRGRGKTKEKEKNDDLRSTQGTADELLLSGLDKPDSTGNSLFQNLIGFKMANKSPDYKENNTENKLKLEKNFPLDLELKKTEFQNFDNLKKQNNFDLNNFKTNNIHNNTTDNNTISGNHGNINENEQNFKAKIELQNSLFIEKKMIFNNFDQNMGMGIEKIKENQNNNFDINLQNSLNTKDQLIQQNHFNINSSLTKNKTEKGTVGLNGNGNGNGNKNQIEIENEQEINSNNKKGLKIENEFEIEKRKVEEFLKSKNLLKKFLNLNEHNNYQVNELKKKIKALENDYPKTNQNNLQLNQDFKQHGSKQLEHPNKLLNNQNKSEKKETRNKYNHVYVLEILKSIGSPASTDEIINTAKIKFPHLLDHFKQTDPKNLK
ncbi:hypothetical protein M0813_06593 [Anaeramoeba flamelloides]|uniref:Uncharacterized protein n=1 Tax=Anaeramoeba flamelloides TaxID=1746091 RepID=A0ABQ8XD82_9EUKA|nr:hypothetical protein M0813_06593 [Anaeramoeba flamelloides]